MKTRECLCGRGQECNALSFAFFVLEDPRSGYTAMPRMIRSESDSPTLLLVSQLRDAYLRNLLKDATPAQRAKASKETSKRQFVANHHFHPQIVMQSTKGQTCKIPWFIDDEMAMGLNLGLTDEDRLRDDQGTPTEEYFLAPTYNIEYTKKDLQRLVRAEKKMSQAKNRVTTSNYKKPWAKENTPTETNKEGEQPPQTFTSRRRTNNDSKEDDDLHSIGNDSILMNWEENCEKPYRETKSPTGTAIELEKSIGPDAFSSSFGMLSPLNPLQASNGNLPSPTTTSPLSRGDTPHTILSSVPDCVEINSFPSGSGGDSGGDGGGTGGDDLSIGMQGLPAEEIQDATTLPQLQNRRPRTYDELLAFEAKRRTYYAAQMTTTLRNLKAVVQLLIEGKRETSRACRLVVSSALASQAYARDMEAIFEDCLVDDTFAIVTNPWQQKNLKQRRNNPDNIFEQHNVHNSGGTPEQELLDKTLEIQSSIGNAFADTARHIEDNIMQEFNEFEKYIVDAVDEKLEVVEDLSGALIHELKTSEKKVQEAWGTLDGIACEELLGDAESECSQGDHTSASQAPKTCPDLWLNEMYYRVSVHYLSSTWHLATAELHKFQQSLVQIEKDRRVRLHELLLEFQPRQKRLGNRALAIVQDPALKHLIDTHLQVSVEDIEDEVKLAVKLQSKTIQKQQTEHRSSILNRTRRSLDYMGDSMAMDLGIEKLDTAVVDSQFVFASKVMERNNPEHATYGGVVWETTLAVITNNSYLHLFHIPHLGKDIAPREAFRRWQSGVQISELKGVWEHEQNAGIQRLLEKVTPSESWFLPKCTVKRNSHHGTEFEIRESAVNMFGKSVTSRKIELKTESASETSHWIDTKMEPNMWCGNTGADIQRVGISAVDKAENLKLLPLTNLPASMLTPRVAPFRKRPSSSSSPPSASSASPVLAQESTAAVTNRAVTQFV